jgi:hypothetical protein
MTAADRLRLHVLVLAGREVDLGLPAAAVLTAEAPGEWIGGAPLRIDQVLPWRSAEADSERARVLLVLATLGRIAVMATAGIAVREIEAERRIPLPPATVAASSGVLTHIIFDDRTGPVLLISPDALWDHLFARSPRQEPRP